MSIAVASAQAPPATTAPTIVISTAEDASEKTPICATPKVPNRVVNADRSLHNQVKTEADPLPADLRLILTEVARTGKCPWLSWNGKDIPEAALFVDVQSKKGGSVSSSSTSRSIFATNRPSSSAFSSFPSKSAAPVLKKYRNGVHVNRRRFSENGSSVPNCNASAYGRKRPLYLTRTLPASGSALSASSIGSGRTSGSEVEDSTQYECDSEGTSATTNSELSVERLVRRRVVVQTSPALAAAPGVPIGRYKTLKEALGMALGLVLDHSYRYRGGYKLSPAEIRIHAAAVAAQNGNTMFDVKPPSSEKIFQQRRKRLLALLGRDSELNEPERKAQLEFVADSDSSLLHNQLTGPPYLGDNAATEDGPPFTIQRIAEVLIAPERVRFQSVMLCCATSYCHMLNFLVFLCSFSITNKPTNCVTAWRNSC